MYKLSVHRAQKVSLAPLQELTSGPRSFYTQDMIIKDEGGKIMTITLFYDSKPPVYHQGIIVEVPEEDE